MKLLLIIAAACLALSGCTAGAAIDTAASATSAIPASPAAVANQTMLDEQAMLAGELAYKAARIAVETGVDAGLIKGATATKVAALEGKAFAALHAARTAYAAGNATSYSAAITEARSAVSDLLALTGKTGA